MFGNPIGGSGYVPLLILYCLPTANTLHRHTLIPPRGYNIVGFSGSCAAWVDGFSIIISR